MIISSSSVAIRYSRRALLRACKTIFKWIFRCANYSNCPRSPVWQSTSISFAVPARAQVSCRLCAPIGIKRCHCHSHNGVLWYLQKVDPNLSAYNIPAAFRIRGDLDSSALEQALNDVIARHEILRSCIKEVDGQPLQESVPDLRMPLPVNDLSNLLQDQAEAEANRLFHADARQVYDLSNAPLLRAKLINLAADDHVLILNFHHMIADGSSLAIFYRELGLFYAAAREAKKAYLPPLTVQYADFAAWQQEWLKSDAFEIQMAYWKHRLADLPTPVEPPNDFDRPALLSCHGAQLDRGTYPKSQPLH